MMTLSDNTATKMRPWRPRTLRSDDYHHAKPAYRDMPPGYLERADTSEELSAIADKIGALDRVRNDVALVYTQRGPIVISIFTYENEADCVAAADSGKSTKVNASKIISFRTGRGDASRGKLHTNFGSSCVSELALEAD